MELEDCPYCGKRHQPGSLNQRLCKAWHIFKDMDLPRWKPEGSTKLIPWPSPVMWNDIRYRILKRDNNSCTWPGCKSQADNVHHIIPIWAGGTDHPENLRSLCYEHHIEIHKPDGGFRPNKMTKEIKTGKQLTLDS